MSRVVRSFSLDDIKDKSILEYYDTIKNKSDYIKRLIQSDLNENKSIFSNEQKNEILNLIKEYLENNNIDIDVKQKKFDTDAIDALNQFD